MKQNERLCWRHSDDLTILLLHSTPHPIPIPYPFPKTLLLYLFIFIFTSFTHLTPTLIHNTKLFIFLPLYTLYLLLPPSFSLTHTFSLPIFCISIVKTTFYISLFIFCYMLVVFNL